MSRRVMGSRLAALDARGGCAAAVAAVAVSPVEGPHRRMAALAHPAVPSSAARLASGTTRAVAQAAPGAAGWAGRNASGSGR